MGKIKELSTLLTNQIAAGEVVERPVSVVKELVENAIDANSSKIDVIIEQAGLSKIQVIDNGDGILKEDMKIAFHRHATSKLYSAYDLFKIKTLGFRGEALPSIASVSSIKISSSAADEFGYFLHLKAGEVVEEHQTAFQKGVNISVENLFFNTPARLKFVSSLQKETSHIADVINRLSLAHPHIAFSLTVDGNQMIKTIGNGNLLQTIAHVYSASNARLMKFFEGENLDFKISGYTSLPEVTRANKNYISVFINGRYIKNYAINQAIINGYKSKLMVGRFPITVLNIEMDFALVDVNVHPTKQQVRISQEDDLCTLIRDTIDKLMDDSIRIPSTLPKKFDTPEHPDVMTQSNVFEWDTVQLESELLLDKTVVPDSLTNEVVQLKEQDAPYDIESLDVSQNVKVASNVQFPMLHYFGQMHGTYLFAQNESGLYIVDQHAAQERIKYEFYRVAIGKVDHALKTMLVPLVLNYTLSEYLKIKEQITLLNDINIYLEEFGASSFIVNDYPAWIKSEEVEDSIRGLIDMLLEQGYISLEKFREDTAIMMSCKKSIKANHYLNDEQARSLLEQLSQCQNPYNCPHGRPVLIHLTNTDMEKMFKRIQDR